MTENPSTPTEQDVQFAETPTGSKAHLVDFGRQSMLAQGTRNATNYASACGQVPSIWDQLAAAPDAADVCARCAQSFLARTDDAPNGIDRTFLMRAYAPGEADG
jgi:hypothetical protein